MSCAEWRVDFTTPGFVRPTLADPPRTDEEERALALARSFETDLTDVF